MIRVLVAHVTVAKSGDMKIRRDLLHLNTPVYSTGWSTLYFVVRRPIRGVLLLDSTLLLANKKLADPRKSVSLIGRTTFSRIDDIVSRGIGWRYQSECQLRPTTVVLRNSLCRRGLANGKHGLTISTTR